MRVNQLPILLINIFTDTHLITAPTQATLPQVLLTQIPTPLPNIRLLHIQVLHIQAPLPQVPHIQLPLTRVLLTQLPLTHTLNHLVTPTKVFTETLT